MIPMTEIVEDFFDTDLIKTKEEKTEELFIPGFVQSSQNMVLLGLQI